MSFAQEVVRTIEEALNNLKFPAASLTGQLNAAQLPPAGSTPYAATSHTHPLSDLEQSGATDGQVATWDDGAGAWVAANPTGAGGGGITIEEVDGTPTGVFTKLKVPNGTLADNGDGSATYTPAAGSGTTSAGAYSSLPAAGTAGNLYLPSDAPYILRDTGAAWEAWGPIRKLTIPPSSGWSWVNQGGATIDTSTGAHRLYAPAAAGVGMRLRTRTAPSTPYTVTAHITWNYFGAGQGLCFVGWRESASGKLAGAAVLTTSINVLNYNSIKYTDATTFSANYTTVATYHTGAIWLRFTDNGTNRVLSISRDGADFYQFHSIGRTDFLTPDQVCFGSYPNDGTYPVYMTLNSWAVT